MKNTVVASLIVILVLVGVAFSGIASAKRAVVGDYPDHALFQRLKKAGWYKEYQPTCGSVFGDLDDGVTLTKTEDFYIAQSPYHRTTYFAGSPIEALSELWMGTHQLQ